MEQIIIPPAVTGLSKAADPEGHRRQGEEPHRAAKEGVRLSSDWRLFADGQEVPVYAAPVTRGGPHSFAQISAEAGRPVAWRAVRCGGAETVELLPASYGLHAEITGDGIVFTTVRHGHVTLLADGDIQQPLTISVGPVRQTLRPEDVQGLYFGPGIHDIDTFDFADGDTIYLAPGALVRARPHPEDEAPVNLKDWAGMKNFRSCLAADRVRHVRLMGQGILDFSLLDWHERNPLIFHGCEDVLVQDVTFVNVPAWTLHLHQCDHAEVDNIKMFGYRENSDGVDIVSSQNVHVHDSFSRTGDDAFVVKAMVQPPVCGGKNILVERCVVWNDKVRCFGIAAESVNDISDVTFRDCDVIRSYADWTLELGALVVYISDKALVSNILFDDIRIDHEVHLATHVMVTRDFWSKDDKAGNIRNVTFRNLQVRPEVGCRVAGYGPENTVEGVHYEHYTLAGRTATSLEAAKIEVCDYASHVTIRE